MSKLSFDAFSIYYSASQVPPPHIQSCLTKSKGNRLHNYFRSKFLVRILSMLAFYLFSLTSSFSRPDTPCTCSSWTVIGTNNATTDITSTTLVPNTCYWIRGTLNINSSSQTVWDEMRFRMAEGSQILVSTSLKITDSYIAGCDGDMWQGIRTNASTTLEVSENTAIEAAEFGIFLANETKFTCRDVEFINNYIGIATGDPFDDNTTDISINQFLDLTGCKFYTSTNLPDPYPGQFYFPSWPTTPYGVPFNQGFAGIYLSRTSGLIIGKNGALTTDRNKFYQLRNGVVTKGSTYDIYGSDFYDFEGSVAKVLSDPLLDINQFGINTTTGHAHIEDNTFSNIKRGVFTERARGTIHNNEFDIPTNDLVPAANRGIVATFSHGQEISSNFILNGYKGIEVFSGSNYTHVLENDLQREVGLPRNTGIEFNGCRYSGTGFDGGVVTSNDITISDEESSLGVSIISSGFMRVNENSIDYITETGMGDNNAGISTINGLQTNVLWNVVNATAGYETDPNNTGILDISFNSFYFCNSMDHFSSLLRIVGTGMSTNLFSNFFFDGTIGFELVAPAMLGTHTHRENKWLGSYNNGAFISGPINLVTPTAMSSTFFVNQNITGNMPPNIGPTPPLTGNWFINAVGFGLDCDGPSPLVEYDEDTLVALVLNDFDFDEYSNQMEWQVKANIFEIILNNPSLLSNHVLDSFFGVEENTVLGQLILAQNGLFTRTGVNQSAKDDSAERIIALSADLVRIDSVLSAGGAISINTWFNLRTLKADSLASEQVIWMDLIEDEDDATITQYEDIEDDLNGITATNDLEDYLKESLLLHAQFLLGVAFSAGDSSDIVDLINLCPIEGGRAIGIAQGLYSMIADSNMIAYIPECPSPSPFAIGSPTPTFTDFENLSIAPNPTTGELWIKSMDQILEISIFGSDSRTIFTSNPKANRVYLDLDNFSNGIYIVTIHTQNGMYSQKIILLK